MIASGMRAPKARLRAPSKDLTWEASVTYSMPSLAAAGVDGSLNADLTCISG